MENGRIIRGGQWFIANFESFRGESPTGDRRGLAGDRQMPDNEQMQG